MRIHGFLISSFIYTQKKTNKNIYKHSFFPIKIWLIVSIPWNRNAETKQPFINFPSSHLVFQPKTFVCCGAYVKMDLLNFEMDLVYHLFSSLPVSRLTNSLEWWRGDYAYTFFFSFQRNSYEYIFHIMEMKKKGFFFIELRTLNWPPWQLTQI